MSLFGTISTNVNLAFSGGSCCASDECSGPTSGTNVFAITKAEYDAYKAGGTWTLACYKNTSESGTQNGESVSSSDVGSGTITGYASGCQHSVSGTFSSTSSGDAGTYNRSASLTVNLGYDANSGAYYAEFIAMIGDIQTGTESSTSYPPEFSITAAGNPLAVYSVWNPSWVYLTTGYSCTGYERMVATFLS